MVDFNTACGWASAADGGIAVVSLTALDIVLGIDNEMKIFMISFASFFPVLLNTYSGVRSVAPVQLQNARTFGVSGRKLLWQIVLPSASPYIFTGMRVSLAVALIVMVIS